MKLLKFQQNIHSLEFKKKRKTELKQLQEKLKFNLFLESKKFFFFPNLFSFSNLFFLNDLFIK